MYRYHNLIAEILTALAAKPIGGFVDGTYYLDKAGGYIFLYASGFSTYAIGFTEQSGGGGGGGGWTPPTPTPTKPEPTPDITDPTVTGVADWLNTDDHIVYLNGYPNGTVAPDGSITRAEVAMIFYRLLRDKNVPIAKSYTDVSDDEWYAQAVGVLSSLGILRGYEKGDFRPQNPITRAEFAAIATRFAKATGGDVSFYDVPRDHWAYGNIATASTYGWVNGYGDGTFGPQGQITRAETAAIVNRMLARAADEDWVLANPDKIRYFLDLQDPKKWYYFDLVEASNEHDFTKDNGVEKWGK